MHFQPKKYMQKKICKLFEFVQRTYPSSESGSKSSCGECGRSRKPSSGGSAIIGMLVSLLHARKRDFAGRCAERCGGEQTTQSCCTQRTLNQHQSLLGLPVFRGSCSRRCVSSGSFTLDSLNRVQEVVIRQRRIAE